MKTMYYGIDPWAYDAYRALLEQLDPRIQYIHDLAAEIADDEDGEEDDEDVG